MHQNGQVTRRPGGRARRRAASRVGRRLRLMAALCALACFVVKTSGCAGSGGAVERRDFAYADGAFSVSLRGKMTRLSGDASLSGSTAASPETAATRSTDTAGGHTTVGASMSLSAEVSVSAPHATGARDLSLLFSAPEALAGVRVTAVHETAADGSRSRLVTVTTAEGVTLDDRATPGVYDAFLRFAEALLPVGDVTKITPVRDGARSVTCRTPDGTHTAVFTFNEDGGLPITVRVESPSEVLDMTVTPRP